MAGILADISEFQTDIDAGAYIKYHKTLICRVHNGHRPDYKMPGRLAYLRQFPFTALGLYQYFSPTTSPASQAQAFIDLVGRLHVNEFAILDVEEGSGSQVARAEEWFTIVDGWANMLATLYSGLSFLETNLGGHARWHQRPIWVAAYGQSEPTIPHVLWQYADNQRYDAITPPLCDSSIFHGSAVAFRRSVREARRK